MTKDRFRGNDCDAERRELQRVLEEIAVRLDRAIVLAESLHLDAVGRLNLSAARRYTHAAWRKGAL